MRKIILYIGADNVTGDSKETEIAETLSKDFDGFTLVPCVGYYKGKKEYSTMAIFFTDYRGIQLRDMVRDLCTALGQDCILVEDRGDVYLVNRDGSVSEI